MSDARLTTSPTEVFDEPWNWETITRDEALASWRLAPVVTVTWPSGSRGRAEWFGGENTFHRGAAPLDLGAVRYLRRVGADAPVSVRARTTTAASATTTTVAPPVAARPAPAPQPPPPRRERPAAPPQVVCRLITVEAACSHGGRKDSRTKPLRATTGLQAGVLHVVPTATGDTITLAAKHEGGCGRHPEWEIAGFLTKTERGARTTFRAQSWELAKNLAANPIAAALPFLSYHRVTPHKYRISTDCCDGRAQSLEVWAYPSDKWTIELSIDEIQNLVLGEDSHPAFKRKTQEKLDDTSKRWQQGAVKSLQQLSDRFKTVSRVLQDVTRTEVTLEFLKGKFTASGQWEESDSDYRAYYKWDLALGFNPVIGGSVKVPFGPASALPGFVTKYIGNAALFVLVKAEMNFMAHGGRRSPDECALSAELSGGVELQLGVELFLLGKDVLSAEVAGVTAFTGKGEAAATEPPEVLYEIAWDGLKGLATVSALKGLIAYKREVIIAKPRKILEDKWPKSA